MTAEATILIVDDEPRVLDSLEALLAMDYRVLRAERPEAALGLLAGEDVALVISDQRMPGMSGTELLSRCCEVAPETVRVLLTDRKSTRLNSSHIQKSRMPSSA